MYSRLNSLLLLLPLRQQKLLSKQLLEKERRRRGIEDEVGEEGGVVRGLLKGSVDRKGVEEVGRMCCWWMRRVGRTVDGGALRVKGEERERGRWGGEGRRWVGEPLVL